MTAALPDHFTSVQRTFLEQARHIAPLAVDRTEPLYRFLRYANENDRQCVHDALVNRHFRFGRPRSFNDPFDCRPHLRLPGAFRCWQRRWYEYETMRLVRERFPGDAQAERRAREDLSNFNANDLVATTELTIRDRLLDTQQMLCLCGNQRHVLMWAYYADRHRGVAIHLRPSVWPIATAMRVSYSNRYPTLPLSILNDKREIVRQFVLKKAKGWRHENEYRVLVQDDDALRLGTEWKDQCTAILPKDAVTGITVGSLMDDQGVQDVVTSANAASPVVPVFRAKTHRKEFTLAFERIT